MISQLLRAIAVPAWVVMSAISVPMSVGLAADWVVEEVDNSGSVGKYLSIMFDHLSRPMITYYDATNVDLKTATLIDGEWVFEIVDSVGGVGQYPSAAVDSLDRRVFSYYNIEETCLMYAGSILPIFNWTMEEVDNSGSVGKYSSIMFDHLSRPMITYYDATSVDLKTATLIDGEWVYEIVDSVGGVGQYPSAAVDSLDRRVFSYYNIDETCLMYAGSVEPLFKWTLEEVDNAGDVGKYSSLAFGDTGQLALGYCDVGNGNLKVAFRDGSGWALELVENATSVGLYNSLAYESGRSRWHASYYDAYNTDLHHAIQVIHNVALDELLSPSEEIILSGTSVDPQVIIRNGNRNPEDGVVQLVIGDTYVDEITLSLGTGQIDTAAFSAWTPTADESYPVVCSVAVIEDEIAWDNVIKARAYASDGIGPEIHRISPYHGVTNTLASTSIHGVGFVPGMTARLHLAGESDIVADDSLVAFVDDSTITATFNLENAVLDKWDLEVRNLAGESYTAVDGFEVFLYDGDLLPFGEWHSFAVHDGTTIEIGAVEVPKGNDIFMLLKKTNLTGHNTWVGDVRLLDQSGNEIVSSTGGSDVAFQIANPQSGLVRLAIHAYDPGTGQVIFCDQIPQLTMREWHVGEVLRPWGMDWTEFEVPEGVTTLYIQTEGFGDNSYFNVYREHLNNPLEQWHFGTIGQGFHIEAQIQNPPAGKYFIEYTDSHTILNSPSQVREYMVCVSADMEPPPLGLPPTITDLSTYVGGQGPVTVMVSGQGLDSAATVSLIREGYENVVADPVYGDSNRVELSAHFDLAAVEPGDWQLVVTNPGGEADTAGQAFEVRAESETTFSLDIVGRDAIRVGRWQTVLLNCVNTGDIDIPFLLLSLQTPENADVAFRFTNLESPPYDYMNWEQVDQSWDSDSGRTANFVITDLKARTTFGLEFQLCSQVSGVFSIRTSGLRVDRAGFLGFEQAVAELARLNILDNLDLADTLETLANDSSIWWYAFQEGLDLLGFEEGQKMTSGYSRQDRCMARARDTYGFGSLLRFWLDNPDFEYGSPQEVLACVGWGSHWLQHILIKSHCDGVLANFCLPDGSCDPRDLQSVVRALESKLSCDPEDKYGPTGFDLVVTALDSLSRFTSSDRGSYGYRIDFWNDSSANGDAQIVTIRDTIDTDFDLSTFRFDEFGFLKWTVPIGGSQYFDVDVDMRPDMNLIVNVEGTLDPDHRAVEWAFTSHVPGSDTLPDLIGFLPPIDSLGYNVGWVDFSIDPLPGLPTGTRLTNQCYSNFDSLPPCDTCPLWTPAPKLRPWVNTIDAGAPTSGVLALDSVTEALAFPVYWGGQDDSLGSGIGSYTIYYAVDDTLAFMPWLEDTSATEAVFDLGSDGHTYYFYSVATDNVGHVEATPVGYDARTTIDYTYICGDVNGSGGSEPDISDLVYLVQFMFQGGPEPPKIEAADVNCSGGGPDIADLVYLVQYMFQGGPEPCAPCNNPAARLAVSRQKGTVTLTTRAVDSTAFELVLDGKFSAEVAGLQQRYSYDASRVAVDSIVAGPRNAQVDVYYHAADGVLSLGMIDIKGQNCVPAGSSELATIYARLLEPTNADSSVLTHQFTLAADKRAAKIPIVFKDAGNAAPLPKSFALHQNYPNPFNSSTIIKYDLPVQSQVKIDIYNVLGQRVTTLVDEHQDAGYHEVIWHGTNDGGGSVASGVYFYRISSDKFVRSKKMVLLK